MTVIWCMVPEIWSATDRTFCHSGLFFALLPFYPFWDPESQPKISKFWKNKKTPWDIITLHMCTINYNHMMYGSWDTECNRHNFLSFWTIFCLFTPLKTWKIKIWKKWKKCLEISFYTSVPKKDHIIYCSWDMACDRCNCYFSFWAIFCPFTPTNSPKNQYFKKMKKTPWIYHHFTYVYQKLWLDDVQFLRNGAQQMDGKSDT